MQRSRQRKIVKAMPPFMTPILVRDALKGVRNTKTKAKLEARYARHEAAQ